MKIQPTPSFACASNSTEARYYNRGACDLDPLEKGDAVRVEPLQVVKKEWQNCSEAFE